MAQNDCGKEPQLKYQLGGTFYDPSDQTTFWTSAEQFFTWWKNNVERTSKFRSLIVDANYAGYLITTLILSGINSLIY